MRLQQSASEQGFETTRLVKPMRTSIPVVWDKGITSKMSRLANTAKPQESIVSRSHGLGMNRLLTRWDLLGISFVILEGSALHFAFAWSGYWKPMALVAPVNESVWEHFKLAFWPALLWAFLEGAMRGHNARAFWSAKGYALLVAPILIAIMFYGYTAVLGRNIFALDIATFVIAVVAAQLASAQLLKADICTRWARSIGISLLLCQLVAYSTFTYCPPPLGLFEDGRNGIRGIPPNVTDIAIVSGRDGGDRLRRGRFGSRTVAD